MSQPPPLDAAAAASLLAEVDAHPTILNISRARARLAPAKDALAGVKARIACLASFTFEPLQAPIELQALRAGLALDVYLAPFGQFDRELIDSASGLAAFRPDVVLLALRLQDVCPALHEGFNALPPGEADRLVDDWIDRLRSALLAFRRRCPCPVLIQDYDLPATPSLGIADRASPGSQRAAIQRANRALDELAASIDNLLIMDYDALVARAGRAAWQDRRMALFARIPVAPAHYWALAGFYVRHLRPLFGLTRKVLVLDADNTLWGGIVGDAGPEGIALGPDYPGSAYVAFQKRVLDLYHRGVVLCLASKNEPASVDEVLRRHPAMVLRPEHFAASRVNWLPKPDNLRAMAAELNLGLDSFVFIDDSPVECALVRAALPQVLCVTLPREPADYAAVVEALDCFDQWTISAEDRRRGEMYRAEAGRRALQTTAVDMPSFYRQLQMRMTLAVNDPADIPRAAQMTARTNQFNMHTLRCSEDDIRRFMTDGAHEVITLALDDRFGDNGVVGLAVVRKGSGEWTLHLLLMSCRVLGRTVEQCFIYWIAGRARRSGARALDGEFAPTARNRPFAGFYSSCGFQPGQESGGIARWRLDLASARCDCPDWMHIVERPPAQAP